VALTGRSEDWKSLIAVGLVAGDLIGSGIARYAGVHLSEAEAALEMARQSGVLDADDAVDHLTRLELVAGLPNDVVAGIHAAAARRLFAAGPDRFVDALNHARAAGTLVSPEEMVAMADQGGRMSLSVSDYASAKQLLELAVELDTSHDLVAQGHRLCDLATATDGLGDVVSARQHLMRAVTLGELAGNPALVVRAAAQHALPADWYTGDPHATGLLQRAELLDLSREDTVRIKAARAFTENRIPLIGDDGQQLAWVTRTAVAQGFADEALDAATDVSPEARLLALLAWRTTHRSPRFLTRRREVSTEALDLAQRLRNPSHQVEAAVMLATDAIESGDRPLLDQSLAVARWIAQRDGNPRLQWRAYTLAAGAAHLDGDADAARHYRQEARRVGEPIGTPGWLGAEFLLIGEEVISDDDPVAMRPYLFDESFPGLANPIGRACIAYLFARNGDLDTAERYVRRSIRQLDEESSFLLLATRIAAVAELLDANDLLRDLAEVLTPWAARVAVDSHSWWCDGPVSLWLASIYHRLGDDAAARRFLDLGEPVARSINDVRSMRRVELLRSSIRPARNEQQSCVSLTPRELEVLALLAKGATNPEIAHALAYSLSTIRMDTISIYKKLDVKGRSEAVARATSLHLLTP